MWDGWLGTGADALAVLPGEEAVEEAAGAEAGGVALAVGVAASGGMAGTAGLLCSSCMGILSGVPGSPRSSSQPGSISTPFIS